MMRRKMIQHKATRAIGRVLGGLILALGVLSGLALPGGAARAEQVYQIDGEVWDHYQKYLDDIGHGRKPGAYAITTDGSGAFYFWCEEIRCMAGKAYSTDAKDRCEAEYGTECVVFAIRDEIKVRYEIRKPAGGGSASAAPLSPPPPATTIKVAAAVQADIDQYLRNAQTGGGKVWALAIAKDGTEAVSANCPVSGGYSGGGACDPLKGGAPELAAREAIKRCGGPSTCVQLYAGTQKIANIETVPEGGSAAAPTPAPEAVASAPATAPAAQPPAEQATQANVVKQVLRIDGMVYGQYQQYLQRIGSTRPGAFAVTEDGEKAYYVWCESQTCTPGAAYGVDAKTHCQQEYFADCVVLAIGREEQAAYEVVGRVATPGTPEPAPPPVTKIAASADVRADIDKYLGNTAKSGGKVWALAIAKDGSVVASAACPVAGSWSGGTACEPVKGAPQELANREAIKRCGGPADCLLLYVGQQKAAGIEVTAP